MNKEYKKYIDSGLDWVGKIPYEWSQTQLKYISSISKGKKAKEDYQDFKEGMIPYLSMEYLRNQTESPSFVFEDDSNVVLVDENDLLILWDGSKAGEIVKAKKGALSSTMGKIHLESQLLQSSFLAYYLKYAEQYIQANTVGMGIPHVSGEVLRTLFIACPNLKEQTQIASYLDHQTAIIDELIKQKEKLIELLKEKRQAVINEAVTKGLNPKAIMKDSGDKWIGKIPSDWNLSKIKFIAKIQGRVGYKGYTKEDIVSVGEGALTLGAKHIDKENNLNLSNPEYIKWEKYYESPEIMVKKDDVIFTQRGSLGKVCHINSDIGKATINPSMVILSPIKVFPRYLYYWLACDRIQNEVEVLQSNTAVPMISQFQLSNFPITLPPYDIQKEIVQKIDSSIEDLKRLMDFSFSQIEKLKEYRQSIISEAVTGKIDVREWQPDKQTA